MEKYTIQTVLPTGKTNPTYGTEYHIKFAESEQTFKLWFKTPPKEGQIQEGTIDDWKFTKAKKEFVSSQTNSGAPAKRTYGAVEKDKQDGMRQGMCINNAAAYVNTMAAEPVDAKKWAKTVWNYALELYLLGDLHVPVEETAIEDAPQPVKDVFGVTK